MIKTGLPLGIELMKEFKLADIKFEPTLIWGEASLFSLDDANDLLEFCELHDVAVLGIEGFEVAGGKRTPDMDCIADFSALVAIAGEAFPIVSIKAAKDFSISISNKNILLEFVLVKA